MLLVTKLERAGNNKRTHPELRLHGTVPWPEEATPESLLKTPSRLIDVDAGTFAVGGLPFRTTAALDVLAPDEIDDEMLASVLNEQREALLQSPGIWSRSNRVWVRFARDEGPPPPNVKPGDHAPWGIDSDTVLKGLIEAAQARLRLRRKRMLLRVRQVVLEDFRGIEHLTFAPSPAQTTVFVGANGSGKSTLLMATALPLYHLYQRVEGAPGLLQQKSFLRDDDVRNGRDFARIKITATIDAEAVTWAIGRSRGLDTPADVQGSELDAMLNRLGSDIRAYRPVIVHFGVNRAVHEVSFEDATSERALPKGTSDFSRFFEWFRHREDLENETRIHDSAHRDPQLQAVRRAIPPLIPGFENLRVQRAPLRMLVNKGEWTLYVDQLSDGEKCLLAMAGYLARRLAEANPYADDPLLGGGVVLIDEIELHLHPAWQRRVVPALERTFPNVQFILTTHSPAVLGHVDRDSVFILKPEGDGLQILHPDASRGAEVSRILEDVLDVPARPAEFRDELTQLYELIDDGQTADARTLYTKLAATLGALDPGLVTADVLLRRREAARP